ncbi:conserved hypothetical protein [Talaromyces stipitatus ATCC 10500]|uniref:HD/PDEase domain-containing protein n=1 Tax=Talaromyces stipitatus (strain ATCC 10500 / CBS 375.48 / QM 6759 / NRRL 1006) TaxID=441959 RepID=B8M619_TALSN|nr:uncharacterized protein TSTA_023540 [Talaromyces stipitatus ATCC 10500]EED19019.1 conserved hypothetical protein [Talaromyces stipitatus ATCC 10500]
MEDARETAKSLLSVLENYGQGDYIGESISQLEHSLQAAHQARQAGDYDNPHRNEAARILILYSGARDELVLAALLHDIGQIVPLETTQEVRMTLSEEGTDNVGRIGHEVIGAHYLQSLGFSETVCRLVKSHVAAKRYLTAVNKSYYNSLSSASQRSLAFQGGPFLGNELEAFEGDPLRDEMVSLRLWDDAAKVVGVEKSIPRAQDYLEMMVSHLTREESSS